MRGLFGEEVSWHFWQSLAQEQRAWSLESGFCLDWEFLG